MISSAFKHKFAVAVLAATAFVSSARADLVPALDSITGSGPYAFNYHAVLTSNERLDTPGPETFTGFFTIYDIFGLISAAAPAGWQVSVQDPGTTPTGLTPIDGPLPNVTFTYIGTGLVGTGQTITGFSITSSVGSFTVGNYTQQSTNNLGQTSGQRDFNGGFIAVPASAVPEPASYVLFGAGAFLVGIARKFKR